MYNNKIYNKSKLNLKLENKKNELHFYFKSKANKINLKLENEKGAITLFILIAIIFLIFSMFSIFMRFEK